MERTNKTLVKAGVFFLLYVENKTLANTDIYTRKIIIKKLVRERL